MSGERLSIWEDVHVKAALAAGRDPSDICCLSCPGCGHISYYNQGSRYGVISEDEDPPFDGSPCMRVDYLLTLADVADAECADYP